MNRLPLHVAFFVLAACSSAPESSTLAGARGGEPGDFSPSVPKNGSTNGEGCTGSGEFATCSDPTDPADPAADPSGTSVSDAGTDGAPASSSTTNTQCKAGMECKPGSIRYCDSQIAEWTKSTCDATGKWGPCVETTAPNGPSCDPGSYSPEKCCPGLKLCCQDEVDGPFIDYGSGGCAAIACP